MRAVFVWFNPTPDIIGYSFKQGFIKRKGLVLQIMKALGDENQFMR